MPPITLGRRNFPEGGGAKTLIFRRPNLPPFFFQDDNWGESGRLAGHDSSDFVDGYNNSSTLPLSGGGPHRGSGFLMDPSGGAGAASGEQPLYQKQVHLQTERGMSFRCRRHAAAMAAWLLAMLSVASPIVMVALPSLRVSV